MAAYSNNLLDMATNVQRVIGSVYWTMFVITNILVSSVGVGMVREGKVGPAGLVTLAGLVMECAGRLHHLTYLYPELLKAAEPAGRCVWPENQTRVSSSCGCPLTAVCCRFLAPGAFSARRICELLDKRSKIEPDAERDAALAAEGDSSPRNLAPGDFVGAIRFEDVEFNYPTIREKAVLRKLSFEVKPGQKVALGAENAGGMNDDFVLPAHPSLR